MEVKIGNKKFKLDKVSIFISDLYFEYISLTNEPLTIGTDIDELTLEYEIKEAEADGLVEKKRAQLGFLKAVKNNRKEMMNTINLSRAKRDEILKEIVLLNGYEYDETLWKHNFSDKDFTELSESLLVNKKKDVTSSI